MFLMYICKYKYIYIYTQNIEIQHIEIIKEIEKKNNDRNVKILLLYTNILYLYIRYIYIYKMLIYC